MNGLAVVLGLSLFTSVALAAPFKETAPTEQDKKDAAKISAEVTDRAEKTSAMDVVLDVSKKVVKHIEEESAAFEAEGNALVKSSTMHHEDIQKLHDAIDTVDPDNPPSFRDILGDTDIALMAQRELDAAMDAVAEEQAQAGPPIGYRIYASRSMGEEAMRNLVELGKQRPDVVIVFRGLMPGESLDGLMTFLKKFVPEPKEGDPVPNIMLEPTAFRDNGVTRVPTLEKLDVDGKPIAWVRGVVNPGYIDPRVEDGETGDLGVAGPTAEIAEEDLIDRMKATVAAQDWNGAAQRAPKRFWSNQVFQEIPLAAETRRREFDPTIVIQEDVVTVSGMVLARAGDRINPFDEMPFDMTLIVFDGRDSEQVIFAKRKAAEAKTNNVMLVSTHVDTGNEDGWGSYFGMVETLAQPVYLLQPEMPARFGIERVPSVITGGDRVLYVDEFAHQDFSQGGENGKVGY